MLGGLSNERSLQDSQIPLILVINFIKKFEYNLFRFAVAYKKWILNIGSTYQIARTHFYLPLNHARAGLKLTELKNNLTAIYKYTLQ